MIILGKRLFAIGTMSVAALGSAGSVHAAADSERPTVVLVHGAFADGSSWGPFAERTSRRR